MNLTLLTPTGGRPEAFALCEKYLARQRCPWQQWIVVDDCDPPTRCTLGQQVVRPEPRWLPDTDQNTQHRNMLAGLGMVTGDAVAIIEDDDWYSPEYLFQVHKVLAKADLVGEIPARFYNVRWRMYKKLRNALHASLCQTAFRTNMLPLIEQTCRAGQWIDKEFWLRSARQGLLYPAANVCGIKGLPGRLGVGRAHDRHRVKNWTADPGMSQLRQWIGADCEYYAQFKDDIGL